ncbi:hypothetical protein TNCT_59451 [Trichonephila clavata]|uniref:Uncharacterized protein n=1 Tax=Trichonephila clavata TaxID=2740835 RepID=A0A8X6LXB4_TRICU|nr:hypothetical protein TNCT_59451 [Trichonephila clavata]
MTREQHLLECSKDHYTRPEKHFIHLGKRVDRLNRSFINVPDTKNEQKKGEKKMAERGTVASYVLTNQDLDSNPTIISNSNGKLTANDLSDLYLTSQTEKDKFRLVENDQQVSKTVMRTNKYVSKLFMRQTK